MSPRNRRDAIELLADQHKVGDGFAEIKYMEAEQIENENGMTGNKLISVVFNNLINDLRHYDKHFN